MYSGLTGVCNGRRSQFFGLTGCPTLDAIGHFKDDRPSQSLEWCKNPVFPANCLAATSKPDLTVTKLQHKASIPWTVKIGWLENAYVCPFLAGHFDP